MEETFIRNEEEHGGGHWSKPTIPTVSVLALAAVARNLTEKHIMFNVPGFTFHSVIENIIERAIEEGILPESSFDPIIELLTRNNKRQSSPSGSLRSKRRQERGNSGVGEGLSPRSLGQRRFSKTSLDALTNEEIDAIVDNSSNSSSGDSSSHSSSEDEGGEEDVLLQDTEEEACS